MTKNMLTMDSASHTSEIKGFHMKPWERSATSFSHGSSTAHAQWLFRTTQHATPRKPSKAAMLLDAFEGLGGVGKRKLGRMAFKILLSEVGCLATSMVRNFSSSTKDDMTLTVVLVIIERKSPGCSYSIGTTVRQKRRAPRHHP